MGHTSATTCRTGLKSAFFAALLLVLSQFASSLALADRVVLGLYKEQVYRDIKTSQPDWSEAKIREVMSDTLLTRAELLDGIPESSLRERNGRLEIIGRVKKLIPGLRQGDRMDRIQHDKLVMETGLDGQGKVVELSALNVSHTLSSIDSAEDFAWLFSNRHALANVAPGSDLHRRIFYSLVDADGWLGLVEQPLVLDDEEIEEGAYSAYLLKGRPSPEAHLLNYEWARAEQFTLRYAPSMQEHEYGPDILDEFNDWFDNLLWAAARARKYPGYPAGMDRWALDSLDMLCGLRFSDPVLTDGVAAQIAWRARSAGHSCFQRIAGALAGNPSTVANSHDPDRPLNDDEIKAVTLELIERSPYLGEVVLAGPVAAMPEIRMDFPTLEIPAMPGIEAVAPTAAFPLAVGTSIRDEEIQPDYDSLVLARALVNYMTDESQPEALRQQAHNIVRNWIRFDPIAPEDNNRHWREMVWNQASGWPAEDGKNPAQLDVLKLICEEGWMLPVDMEQRIERAHAIAWDYSIDNPSRSQALLIWLSIVRQTALKGPIWSRGLVRIVDDQFPDPDANLNEKETAVQLMWEAVGAKPMSCNSLSYMDML